MAVDIEAMVAGAAEWVGAADVRDMLVAQGVPGADQVHEQTVQHRLALIQTAAGLALLERHEEAGGRYAVAERQRMLAGHDMQLAATAMAGLGIEVSDELPIAPEEEPDRLLSEADFKSCASGSRSPVPARLWSAIMAQQRNLADARRRLANQEATTESREWAQREVDELQHLDGLVIGNRMSLRRFKELAQLGLITGRNIGDGALGLINEITKLDFDEAPAA
jgi:hypothetical protein